MNLAATILAEGFACAFLAPYGVRCENEYQAISSACPGSRDKADWIFSMYYKMTGSCDTTPSSTKLAPSATLAFFNPSVRSQCLDRRTTPDTCIGDRASSLSSTLLAASSACARMQPLGVDCVRDYPVVDCPTQRDYADWVFSTHYLLTGTCVTSPYVSLVVTRATLSTEYVAVKERCLERRS